MNLGPFELLQSGDTVTVHYGVSSGSPATITGTLRRLVGEGEIVVLTTPTGENDPALQTIHYFKNYYRMERTP